jgi:hypothetical protein
MSFYRQLLTALALSDIIKASQVTIDGCKYEVEAVSKPYKDGSRTATLTPIKKGNK